MVGEDGDDIQELLFQHSPFPISRLRPDLVNVQLAEDAENLIQAA